MYFREEIGESLTLKFAQAANDRRKRGLPIISLGLGEPDFDVPASVIDATIEVLRTTKSGYSDSMGLLPLRKNISNNLNNDHNINSTASNILVTAGAKQAFQMVCMALLEPADEIIVLNPSFVSFIPQLYIAEPYCKVIEIDINKSDFSLPIDEIRNKISTKTKLLILNSPNNPAGYVISESQLTYLFKLAENNGFYIISDEIYEKLIFEDQKQFSIGSLETEPFRVFTINGFSKSHSMTGWRLGYVCFPKTFGSKLLKLQQHMNTNTCTFIQEAMVRSFDIDQSYLKEYNLRLSRRILRLKEIISGIDTISLVTPSAGFFAFLNISKLGIDSNTFCSRLIEETGVATTPGIAFGTSWDDHVRISYATSDENLDKGISLMCEFIKSFKNSI
jgi:aspartate aminotransferase